MSEFTQGPWVAKGGEVCTEDYEAEGQVMHDHICCCEVVNGESPNANLIAAAPELLEACLRIQAQFRQAGVESKAGSLNPIEDNAAQIDAVILKALGQ